MTANPSQNPAIDARVLSLLACPVCHAELRQEGAQLECPACGRKYPIVDGIPVLTPQS